MNREELIRIMGVPNSSLTDVIGPKWEKEIADSILAALAKERENEVALAEGEMGEDMMMEATCNSIVENGKRGTLIFRRDV